MTTGYLKLKSLPHANPTEIYWLLFLRTLTHPKGLPALIWTESKVQSVKVIQTVLSYDWNVWDVGCSFLLSVDPSLPYSPLMSSNSRKPAGKKKLSSTSRLTYQDFRKAPLTRKSPRSQRVNLPAFLQNDSNIVLSTVVLGMQRFLVYCLGQRELFCTLRSNYLLFAQPPPGGRCVRCDVFAGADSRGAAVPFSICF